ncbi:hypothetical protein GDO86_000112 [Hymenochirus boettgeri]|uniref:N-acetyltransferase domain-containing protein n=1 Tax=Hymenochirus boettgeri TaxID=247094 RepID=A0A8T2KFE3_9PIPI|nr:hypothetical protein GDO86_000112 [Hymenochirus boettgeri]
MAVFSIRRYSSNDSDAVRMLFAQGMMGLLPTAYFYLLKLPQMQVTIFIPFIALYLVSKSYLLSFVGLAILMGVGWFILKLFFHKYVDKCHREDLKDIETFYVMSNNSCFWVAEINGKVIGMVGAKPTQNTKDELELRRLSVAVDHRMQGVAEALCMKVIGFAEQHGYKHVILNTSVIQPAARRLYERIGFENTNVKVPKFTNLSHFYYTYTILRRKQLPILDPKKPTGTH